VIHKLWQADADLGKGNTVAGVCKLLGKTERIPGDGGARVARVGGREDALRWPL